MKIEKTKTVCFSGHRTEKLPKCTEELEHLRDMLREQIDKAITDGYDTFIFGVCEGFDLMAAQMILYRKRVIKLGDPPNIKLIAAVPYEEQPKDWSEDDRNLYFETLALCDEVITLSTHYRRGIFYERNRFMVDNSTRLICYCKTSKGGTKYTLDYAEKQGLEIINLK